MNAERLVKHSETVDDVSPRSRIVAVARARIAQYGYPKTSMQEIAADCGMSAANLYRYFEGKLAIGLAIHDEFQVRFFEQCDTAVSVVPATTEQRLIALFHAVIDGTRQQIHSTPLLFELSMLITRERPEVRREYLGRVEQRIKGIIEGDERLAGSDAHLVLLATAPFVLPWMLFNTPLDDPWPQVEPLVHWLVAGVSASAPAEQ